MDIWLVLFVSAAFVSVAGITFSVGHLVTSRNRLQRRLPAGARMSDALTLTSSDDVGALAAEPLPRDRFGIGQRFSKELRLKLVRAGYFGPHAVRFYVFARVCAVIAVPSLVLLGCALLLQDLSTLKFVLAAAASVGRRGPWAGRLSVSPSVLANRRVSAEFPGSLGPVDCLRHRGPDRGGVIRKNSGSARQAKPRAWSQHRVDGGRDARGKKLG